MSILKIKPELNLEIASCPAKFLKSQQLLEEKQFAEAQKTLEDIILIFKKHEEI